MRRLSRQKARKMLHEGVARGHQITEKQRRFFGAVASGQPIRIDKERAKRALMRKPRRR